MNTTGKIQKLTSITDEVISLDQNYFPNPWKTSEWSSLDFSQNGLWIYSDKDQTMGLALFSTPPDETAHLLKILIIPEQRGTGIAQKFWSSLVENLRSLGYLSIYLEVEESNQRALSFYEKQGFQILRRVKSYYSNGETGIMMQLTL